jgi:hypothetical protein
LGEILTVNGLPRPAAADDDRIGGWQLMYQLLESDAWLITENCGKLIDSLPLLVRDAKRMAMTRPTPLAMEGDSPVLRRNLPASAGPLRPGRGNPRPKIARSARRASSPACRWAYRSRAR